MNIQFQPQINYKTRQIPTFTSFQQPLIKVMGKPVSTNNTSFFRPDLECELLVHRLMRKYENKSKVNVQCIACSAGVEQYSFAMMLFNKMSDKAKKFLPIIASDIDEKILANPKNGKVLLSQNDINEIIDNVGLGYTKFIKHDRNFQQMPEYNHSEKLCTGTIEPTLRDAIKFEHRDATKGLPDIGKENTILMARNFWPYLPDEEQVKLADNIANGLGKNSVLMLGKFDTDGTNVKNLLYNRGFVNWEVENSFVKFN